MFFVVKVLHRLRPVHQLVSRRLRGHHGKGGQKDGRLHLCGVQTGPEEQHGGAVLHLSDAVRRVPVRRRSNASTYLFFDPWRTASQTGACAPQVLHRLRPLPELVPRSLRGHPAERGQPHRRVRVSAVSVDGGRHDGLHAAHGQGLRGPAENPALLTGKRPIAVVVVDKNVCTAAGGCGLGFKSNGVERNKTQSLDW